MRRARADAGASPVDVRLRVVALMLEPALALAHGMALPMRDLVDLVEQGYFREARGRGLSMRAIARRFDSSLHTVTRLAKESADTPVLLAASERMTVRRRVVLALAAQGGATRSELGRKLRSVAADDLDDALASLAESGVVTSSGERWGVHASHLSLVGPGLEQRLDSVRHLLGAVGEAVRARFFQPEGSRFSLPRVLSFAASRAALEREASAMYAAVKEQVTELDAHASTARDAAQAQLVFVVIEKPD